MSGKVVRGRGGQETSTHCYYCGEVDRGDE